MNPAKTTTMNKTAAPLLQVGKHELRFEMWCVDKLIPYARNARLHPNRQIERIAGSIEMFGFLNPVLITPAGDIVAGHGRVMAARKLGLSEVPVVIISHLTETQRRAFMIADNQLGLTAIWDEDLLRRELEILAAEDFDLTLTGFEDAQLEELLAESRETEIDPDAAPEVPSKPVTRAGDLWILDSHRMLCADGTQAGNLHRALDGALCKLVFCDPPYNVAYVGKRPNQLTIANDNLGEAFSEFLRSACQAMISVTDGSIYICMSSSELHTLHRAFTEAGGHWSTFIIWAKSSFTLGRSDYQRQYEPILYGWPARSKHYWGGARDQSDLWFVDKPFCNDVHPTMKPVELVERAIRNSSRSGDVVLDPFGGSGTTVVACENLGRHAAVIEIDPRYVDVTIQRWQNFSGKTAFLADGRSFDAVQAERSSLVALEA